MSDRELAITIMKWEQEGAKLGGPLYNLIEEIKQLFVEQACGAIQGKYKNMRVRNKVMFPSDAEQAIRDKFK